MRKLGRYTQGRTFRKESAVAEHFTLKNNLIFVLAEAAGGVYNSDQMRTLCEVADNESAFLKITEDQRIGFMLDPNKLPEIQSQVRKCGIILKSYKAAGVPSPRACLGELCTYSQQPSLGDALELTTHLLKSFPSPKRHSTIGINGCGRACLGSSTEDIHVVAEDSGYKISIGGKGSEIPQQAQLLVENVPRAELHIVLERLLAFFYQESTEDERFHDVIERVGLTPFLNCLPEHLMPAIHEIGEDATENSIEETSEPLDDMDTDVITETMSELDELLPEGTEPEGSGLVETSETLTIENLVEQTEMELIEGDEFEQINDGPVLEENDTNEPIVDIEAETSAEVEENQNPTSEAEVDDAAADNNLLEDAEFEDGTLEDVSRIRDAIRTELSMSATEGVKLSEKPTDLLDEIDSNTESDIGTEYEDEADLSSFVDDAILESGDDHLSTASEFNEDSFEELENSQQQQDEDTAQTETNDMVGIPARRRDTKVSSAYQPDSQPSAPQGLQKVRGRLSVKFLEQQLALELPSGMCFELPLDAVQEGSQFSMELPDGELIMERQGTTLFVKLGLIQMKFPIPDDSTRRVA